MGCGGGGKKEKTLALLVRQEITECIQLSGESAAATTTAITLL